MTQTHQRNAQATRQAILDAATEIFSQHGYDFVGVREIARKAGINAALINRYFGSKEALFIEAVLEPLSADIMIDAGHDKFAREMSVLAALENPPPEIDKTKHLLAALRSLGSPEVTPAIKAHFDTQIIDRVSVWLGGENSDDKATLVCAMLLGLVTLKKAIGTETLAGAQDQAFQDRLTRALNIIAE